MNTSNSGARLDRIPPGSFHRRVMVLIGIGMFFDGFDMYLASTVLAATTDSGFSTLASNAWFMSATAIGMTVGAVVTGFLGDRFGRRFTYQVNLAVFGLAAIACALAPTMEWLIIFRFIMGLGLGAEIVVGYSALAEFVPPKVRGRMQGLMTVMVVSGLPASALIGLLIVPVFGWRAMFVIGGVGALVVWVMRKSLPESPRWLESVGRHDEAEAILARIEAESESKSGPLQSVTRVKTQSDAASLDAVLVRAMFPRLVLGSLLLVVINVLVFGFVVWVPTFFVSAGLSIAESFGFALALAIAAPIGAAVGAFTADAFGRKPTILAASGLAIVFGAIYPFVSSPVSIIVVGMLLMLPIYVLVALLFGVYVPELFPTVVRLRAVGICNMFGRAATIISPFIVVALFSAWGVLGVLGFMVALLLLQIVALATMGVESNRRGLESVSPTVP